MSFRSGGGICPPGLRSEIVLDVAVFEPDEISPNYTLNELARANASVVRAKKSILGHRSQHTIDSLSIKYITINVATNDTITATLRRKAIG